MNSHTHSTPHTPTHYTGVGEVDPDYAESLLNPHLEKYPKVRDASYIKFSIYINGYGTRV